MNQLEVFVCTSVLFLSLYIFREMKGTRTYNMPVKDGQMSYITYITSFMLFVLLYRMDDIQGVSI